MVSSYDLQLADCFDYLKAIPDSSIDCVISDPPYATTQLVWDKAVDWAELWPEIYRVCKPSAVQVMFASQPFTTDLIMSNRKRFRYPLVWAKTMPTGFLDANRRPLRAHEDILVFAATGTTTYNPQMTQGKPKGVINRKRGQAYGVTQHYNKVKDNVQIDNGERYPTSVQSFGLDNRSGGISPTQKPLELLAYLVKTYTNPGDTVLDIFSGSGTTAVACAHLGRSFKGCEIDATYHKAATKRLEAVLNQPTMFAPLAVTP